jgi:hypothetical protein
MIEPTTYLVAYKPTLQDNSKQLLKLKQLFKARKLAMLIFK